MAWTDALSVVEKLAPMLATGLLGPLAGGAVSMLEGVFGLTPTAAATTDDRQASIAAAISGATPDQLLALKKADQDYAVQMASLGFKDAESLAALAVQDRSSARDMAVKSGDIWTPSILAFLVVGGWATIQYFLLTHVVDGSMRELIARVLGTLDSALMCVLYFYFGGSASSNRKTELLAQSPSIKE